MGKGAILIGAGFIFVGLLAAFGILISDAPNWTVLNPALLILIGIGVALIVFYRAESEIEQRKDLKTNKKR